MAGDRPMTVLGVPIGKGSIHEGGNMTILVMA